MAGETPITLIGNLTADPELRFTNNGTPVAGFTIANTARTFDKQANEWKDTGTLFLRCTAWQRLAENIATTLTKGTRCIVTGNLTQRSYETQNGERRTVFEVTVTEVGPSLRNATATVVRNQQQNPQQAQYGQQPQWDNQGSQGGAQADDPWANPPF